MVGEWILDVISFQKIFGLCGLKCHIVEIWRDVTFVDVAVFVYLYIFLSYAQNIVFVVRKKRTKLPELGGWGVIWAMPESKR